MNHKVDKKKIDLPMIHMSSATPQRCTNIASQERLEARLNALNIIEEARVSKNYSYREDCKVERRESNNKSQPQHVSSFNKNFIH